MHTNDKATAACRAAMAQIDALSWQAALCNSKPDWFDAQFHPARARRCCCDERVVGARDLVNVLGHLPPLVGRTAR